MSTRCLIAIEQNGSIKAIYCHRDGYYKHVGKVLYEHYHDEQQINELLALGDLSSLGKTIGPEEPEYDDAGMQKEETTVAYYRDMQREFDHPRTYTDRDEFYKAVVNGNSRNSGIIEYLYLFQNGQWYGCNLMKNEEWRLLAHCLGNIFKD